MNKRERLNWSVDMLEVSVRTAKCFQNANLRFVGELVQVDVKQLAKTRPLDS